MTRRLILMRHGKSDWDAGTLSDFDRPLARRGEKEVPRMARWLRDQKLIPGHIVSSPALRARQTTLLVVKELDCKHEDIEWRRDIYEAGMPRLLEALADLKRTAPLTLMVGHNPGMEDLVRHLAEGSTLPKEEKLLPTAAVICLELPDDWRGLRPSAARVVAHMRPRWLKE